MLVRIVKLTLAKENISSFEQIFEETKLHIRNFEGCLFFELYRDLNETNVFFTYSYWAVEEALEAYRGSGFFKAVWKRTKVLFADRPQAWSVSKMETLN